MLLSLTEYSACTLLVVLDHSIHSADQSSSVSVLGPLSDALCS